LLTQCGAFVRAPGWCATDLAKVRADGLPFQLVDVMAEREKPGHGGAPLRRVAPGHAGREKAVAFRALYDARVADVARWIRALGGPTAERDDVLQEVFTVVHRRLTDFDGENEAGWLYKITARQVRDFRRQLWIKRIFSRSSPSLDGLAAPGASPVIELEIRERRALFDRLLSKVKEAQRVSFVLFEIDGYTAQEIADLQGTSVHTVRSRIMRTRKQLAALLRRARATGEA
jgi:RNA polymerase sigma-70 factor, ECF subfamily